MSSESDRSEHRPLPVHVEQGSPLLTPGDAKGIPAPAAMPTTPSLSGMWQPEGMPMLMMQMLEKLLGTPRGLPLRGTSGAPTFNGKEVSEFLRTLHSLFRNHGITREEGKISALCDYVSVSVCEWVESLPEYERKDYEGLEKRLLEEYRDQDSAQAKLNIGWLSRFVAQKRSTDDNLTKYVREFSNVSGELMRRGQLVEFLRTEMFLQGLPEEVQVEVVRRAKISPQKFETMKFARAREAVEEYLEEVAGLNLIRQGREGKHVNFAEEVSAAHSLVVVQPDGRVPDEQRQPEDREPVPTGKRQVPRTAPGTRHQETLDDLAERMRKMEISLMEVRQNDFRRHGLNDIPNRRGYVPIAGDQCRFCLETGHTNIRGTCPRYQALAAQGLCHIAEDAKVRYGPIGGAGEVVRVITNGKSMKESIEEYGKQHQTGNSAVGYVHNMLKETAYIEEVEEEDEEGFMESFVEMEVNALVNAEKRKITPEGRADPKRRALDDVARREEEIPILKTVRPGRYEEIDEPDADVEMEDRPDYRVRDVEEGLRRSFGAPKARVPQRKDAPKAKLNKLADELKNSTDIKDIRNRILNTTVTLSLQELLGMSDGLHRSLFSGTRQPVTTSIEFSKGTDPGVVARVGNLGMRSRKANQMDLEETGYDDEEPPLYVCGTLAAWIQILEDPQRVQALLDGGAEINVMQAWLAEKHALPVTLHAKGTMRSANGGLTPFVGICERVPVRIGSFQYYVPFFIVDTRGGHAVVLGRPFEHMSRMAHTNTASGAVITTIYSMDRTKVARMKVFTPGTRRMETRRDVFEDRRLIGEEPGN